MSFFKGIQWFEWLLIGVVIAMLGAGYILWDKYEKKVEQVGSAQVTNSVLSETVKYKDASATITDEVVTSFVQSQTDEKAELEQSRKGVIDEYIDLATRDAEPTTPAVPVAETPKVGSTPPKANTTNRSTGPVDDTSRIGVIAERMHQHYCKATDGSGDNCSTVGTDTAVLR
uniref:Rz-like spanin n=1 Tax=Pseudomonas phage RVTF4 TaxID=3236931 RepID=A0AB39CD82_9VIRU